MNSSSSSTPQTSSSFLFTDWFYAAAESGVYALLSGNCAGVVMTVLASHLPNPAPGAGRLAVLTGTTRRNVQYALIYLQTLGLIRPQQQHQDDDRRRQRRGRSEVVAYQIADLRRGDVAELVRHRHGEIEAIFKGHRDRASQRRALTIFRPSGSEALHLYLTQNPIPDSNWMTFECVASDTVGASPVTLWGVASNAGGASLGTLSCVASDAQRIKEKPNERINKEEGGGAAVLYSCSDEQPSAAAVPVTNQVDAVYDAYPALRRNLSLGEFRRAAAESGVQLKPAMRAVRKIQEEFERSGFAPWLRTFLANGMHRPAKSLTESTIPDPERARLFYGTAPDPDLAYTRMRRYGQAWTSQHPDQLPPDDEVKQRLARFFCENRVGTDQTLFEQTMAGPLPADHDAFMRDHADGQSETTHGKKSPGMDDVFKLLAEKTEKLRSRQSS